MPELSTESIIMSSNDNSITLTTHRVIQKTNEINKEIFLKDIVSQEVVKRRHGYYKKLALIFGVPTAILLLLFLFKVGPFESAASEEAGLLIAIPAILTCIALYFLLTTYEKCLRLVGKFNEVEFSLKDLDQSSLNKFLNRLTVESDNRKRES